MHHLGTTSCTEGSGQTSSTFQGRKLFIMPSSESPPVPHAEPVRTPPGRAPRCRILEAKFGEFATFGARVSRYAISQFRFLAARLPISPANAPEGRCGRGLR